jgi:hypothetical protein
MDKTERLVAKKRVSVALRSILRDQETFPFLITQRHVCRSPGGHIETLRLRLEASNSTSTTRLYINVYILLCRFRVSHLNYNRNARIIRYIGINKAYIGDTSVTT